MELIEETEAEKQQGRLPQPEPRYNTAILPVKRTEHGQAWVRLAAAIVGAVILVILIVLLARFIYHKAHNHATPNTPTAQNTPAVSNNKQPASTAPKSTSNSSSNSSSTTTTQPTSTKSTTQLTNTGPGNVVAIFVGSSLIAGGLHYLISVRRFAKDS
ncbi:MAG TPA: hypothetical protein VFH37_03080 [Candidatus Saccharimonadales bacterium]|nr:hypothetical protein [Candidatus Saccharimonadales bacterium]